MVRVIYNRKYRDYSTKVDLNENSWTNLDKQKLSKTDKRLKEK